MEVHKIRARLLLISSGSTIHLTLDQSSIALELHNLFHKTKLIESDLFLWHSNDHKSNHNCVFIVTVTTIATVVSKWGNKLEPQLSVLFSARGSIKLEVIEALCLCVTNTFSRAKTLYLTPAGFIRRSGSFVKNANNFYDFFVNS